MGCDEFVRQSTWVTGLAEELARSGGVIRQAAPLTVLQVSKLEHHCRDLKSPCDRCLVGGVLALLYSSGRASDGTRTCTITWDMVDEELEGKVQGPPGYVEARTTKLRRMILPLVVPLVSVSGIPWWEHWKVSRETLGMKSSGELDNPLLCSFQQDGTPNERSIGATEIGKLLRSLLGVEDQMRNAIRSHSLKSTVLSWLAKAGVPLPIRRLAGHHLDPSSKSAETYSRDAMSHVLVEIERVVKLIADKKFLPDATRSGRFVNQTSAKPSVPSAARSPATDDESTTDTESDGNNTGII